MIRLAFVLTTAGNFGGAQKRFANLFLHLHAKNPGDVFFFVSNLYRRQLAEVYPDFPLGNIIAVDNSSRPDNSMGEKNIQVSGKKKFSIIHTVKRLVPAAGIHTFRFIKNAYSNYKAFRKINAVVKTEKIDVLIAVYTGIIPLYYYFGRKNRPSVIFVNMDSWFMDVLPRALYRWHKKFSTFNTGLEKADWVDYLSPYILNGIRNKGFDVNPAKTSITPGSFTFYDKCSSGDKTPFAFAFASRLEPLKNPGLYLEACICLGKKYPEVMFYLMGDGPLKDNLEERLKTVQLKNIIITGFVKDPAKILSKTSVFVSIQQTNNYPSQSVLEAMACGNMIIASDVGDTRMFINTENGLLIDLSLQSLTGAMENCILNRQWVSDCGKNAESYVKKNHTVERISDYYLVLARKVFENRVNSN